MAVTGETFDIVPYGGPVVSPGKEFNGLCSSRVADCWGVMAVLHEPQAWSLVVGYVAAVTVQELPIPFRTFR